MAIRKVQLGTTRTRGKGLCLGTVRRQPRGVPKTGYSSLNYNDVRLPELAPIDELVKMVLRARSDGERKIIEKRYRFEMKKPCVTVLS